MFRNLLVFLVLSPLTVFAQAAHANSDACRPLEAQLKADPGSVDLHEKLIDCYFLAETGSPSQRAEIAKVRLEQVRWLVQHAPEEKFGGTVPATISAYYYPDDYAAIKSEWMTQVQAHPNDAQVLVNASRFVMNDMKERKNREKARELASKACSLDPHNTDASLTLAELYHLDGMSADPTQKARLANQSLQLREQAMADLPPIGKLAQLQYAAKDAFDSGDNTKASNYAELVLQLAQQGEPERMGDPIHQGNLVLGRIALRQGNIEEAKARLLASGNTPGSPVLGSFGPNMMLAKELLEMHQTEVVLQYFDECEKFWSGQKPTLDEWRKAVRRGETPDFGPSLIH